MVCRSWSILFYDFFLIILISNIECLQKTRGKRSPQSSWLYNQQEYRKDESQSTNNEQTNNNTFEIIVLEAPLNNQSHSNIHESAGPQSITLQSQDNIELLSLLYDGKQQPQNRIQANVHRENFEPPLLRIEPKHLQHYDERQSDILKWTSYQRNMSIKNGETSNTERDLTLSDSWRPPPSPPHYGSGRPPPPELYHSPPLPPPLNRGFRERRGPPPHARGRGPPPHARGHGPPPYPRGRGPPPYPRGRGPPHKELGAQHSIRESDREVEHNLSPAQWEQSTDRQDTVPSNNNNVVYDRNQDRGVPLTINQGTAKIIQQSKPLQHLFQVVPVTPEK